MTINPTSPTKRNSAADAEHSLMNPGKRKSATINRALHSSPALPLPDLWKFKVGGWLKDSSAFDPHAISPYFSRPEYARSYYRRTMLQPDRDAEIYAFEREQYNTGNLVSFAWIALWLKSPPDGQQQPDTYRELLKAVISGFFDHEGKPRVMWKPKDVVTSRVYDDFAVTGEWLREQMVQHINADEQDGAKLTDGEIISFANYWLSDFWIPREICRKWMKHFHPGGKIPDGPEGPNNPMLLRVQR